MSLKKLQLGGTIDTAFNDELDNAIYNSKIRKKDMPTIRKYVGTLRDYMASPGEKSLIVDPVTQTYTITGEGASQFNGSDEQIKKNLFGYYTPDEAQKINMAIALYADAKAKYDSKSKLTTNPTVTPTIKTPEKIKLGNLDDHLIAKYGSAESYDWELKQADTDDKRKELVYSQGLEAIGKYRKLIQDNPTEFEAVDLDKVDALEAAIKNKNWDAFNRASFEFGWQPFKYLLSTADKDAMKDAATATTAKTADETFAGAGITDPTLRTNLITNGYSKVADPT